MPNSPNPALPIGSWIYRNWHAQRSGEPEEFAEETQLLSDCRFVGELRSGLGPYLILNTLAEPHEPGAVVPAAVLRVGVHLSDDTQQIVAAFREGVPDLTSFTGGTTHDEFASLVSLAHGVRIAVGSVTRWFHKHDTDGRGSPRHSSRGLPAIPEGKQRDVVPGLTRSAVLQTDLLALYPDIPWQSARELARAARSYRQAVWVANGDGNLAWLLLVSAAETAANEWARLRGEPNMTAGELLLTLRPDYAGRLRDAAGANADAVLKEVGETQNAVLRAQWKFREFLLTFGLNPPAARPKAFPTDWAPAAMKKTLELVYRYRSEALHASQPFPLPMCEAPFPSESITGEMAWAERPGGASYQVGGLWTDDDLPINLYTFHHIVSTALQKWWATLGPREGVQPGQLTLRLSGA